ncbi:MAG: hypothetical protein ACIAQZ_09105 [Sedimentisphaeraceae bacterium JB056]
MINSLKSVLVFILVFSSFQLKAEEEYNWDSLNVADLKWDAEVGLWANYGHAVKEGEKDKASVHNSRFTAGNLLLAGRLGLLSDPRVEQVLDTLESMQSDVTGCIKAHYEDENVTDSNFSFFVCRKLLLLKSCYSDQMTLQANKKLDQILDNFYSWFYGQSLEDSAYYPNKYLGDLVCVRLIQDISPKSKEEVVIINRRMMEASRYWKDHEWGWGEHMSNVYGGTCLDLLSQYLLFSKDKKSRVYKEYYSLLEELLNIEDLYDGGPKIPLIRSYSFVSRGTNENFRDSIKKWEPSMGTMSNNYWRAGALMSAIFYEYGWHEKIEPPRGKSSVKVQIPCFGGNVANSYLKDDIRIGSLTGFPVMPEAENLTWGLAWQSFPVCLWKPEGDWGFLQWQTVEDGVIHAHPTNSRTGPRALSRQMNPPIYGKTYAMQNDGDVLVIRIMPKIVKDWTMITDTFKIADCTANIHVQEDSEFGQILFEYPERTVSVCCVSLSNGNITPHLTKESNAHYWRMDYPEEDLAKIKTMEMVVDVWGISINGKIENKPKVEFVDEYMLTPLLPSQQKKRLRWSWSETNWDVIIDPTSDQPLKSAK